MSREEINALKKKYPQGTRVKLIHMDDEQAPPVGTEGTVRIVDDVGTIHINWDTGSGLGVCDGDEVVIVRDVEETHAVEITVEITCRKAFEVELSDSDYRMLLEGDPAPIFAHGLVEETRADTNVAEDVDYAVWDCDKKAQVVDWSK